MLLHSSTVLMQEYLPYLSRVLGRGVPILTEVGKEEVSQEGPHVEPHGAVERKLGVDHFGALGGGHDGACVQVSVEKGLRALSEPEWYGNRGKKQRRERNLLWDAMMEPVCRFPWTGASELPQNLDTRLEVGNGMKSARTH